jgi:hypothetical protein
MPAWLGCRTGARSEGVRTRGCGCECRADADVCAAVLRLKRREELVCELVKRAEHVRYVKRVRWPDLHNAVLSARVRVQTNCRQWWC